MTVLTFFGGLVIAQFGLHQIKLNALETTAIARIGGCAAALAVSAMAISYLLGAGTPRSVPMIFGTIFFLLSLGARLVALFIIGYVNERTLARMPVAIYGSGSAGIQLALALRRSAEMRPVLFVDDSSSLQNLMVAGLPVRHPDVLVNMARRGLIRKVLIAIPGLDKKRELALVAELAPLQCEVKKLPSYIELIEGGSLTENLRTVGPDELLGRNKVDLDIPEVAKAYAGRVVMVTGGGGSIGSELCRQLSDCHPRRIVIFEHSEFALYEINQELRERTANTEIEIVARLGSVTDPVRLRQVMVSEGVEIVLHAAAYKHVPLVEENELQGARNNVIGTQIVAETAVAAGVERFILVSTDKAVRPTNIMGATKRLAELLVQDLQTRSKKTKLAMVRFGNVLGSSGSVLPLFQRQIAAGGPVTVTHPDVTRFFMTIPEAARLVLLAGAYANGGEVFVLDMGKPMRIVDIARRMIELSGRKVRENGHDGDIEIKITGLRPGEKLYEELLIDGDNLLPTPHEKILRAQEVSLSEIEIKAMTRRLVLAIEAGDRQDVRETVRKYVTGYHTHPVQAAKEVI
jgi:FlaA1/EpsC-like NDP-sugar epimerase